jgi:hypothetical protein
MATFITPCVVRQDRAPKDASRRGLLLRGSIAALAAAAAAPVVLATTAQPIPTRVIATPTAAVDPTLGLCRRYYQLEAERQPAREQLATARLTNDRAGIVRLIAESDRLVEAQADVLLQLIETPASTIAGIAAKLCLLVQELASITPQDDWMQEVAEAFVADADRLLPPLVAA